jgi:hypothetical protein
VEATLSGHDRKVLWRTFQAGRRLGGRMIRQNVPRKAPVGDAACVAAWSGATLRVPGCVAYGELTAFRRACRPCTLPRVGSGRWRRRGSRRNQGSTEPTAQTSESTAGHNQRVHRPRNALRRHQIRLGSQLRRVCLAGDHEHIADPGRLQPGRLRQQPHRRLQRHVVELQCHRRLSFLGRLRVDQQVRAGFLPVASAPSAAPSP